MRRSWVFLGGQAVSMLGNGLASLAVPLLVLRLTRSPAVAVLASLPGSVGYLAVGGPAGVLVDRFNPWWTLVIGDTVRASIFLALFVLTGGPAIAPWPILTLAFAAGGATVFFDTALVITVRDVFTGPRLVSANSWLESANQGGQVLGPGAAGLLAAAGLLHVAMLIDALTFGVSLISLTALGGGYRSRAAPARAAASWPALRRELAEGVRYLTATRLLRTLLLFLLVLNFCLGADKLIVFFARDTLRLPPAQIGLVVAAGGAGGVAAAAATGALCRWLGPLPVIPSCAAVAALALVVMSAATSMPLLLAGNVLYISALIVASVTLRALRQVLVPRPLLGRVTAAWRLGGQAVTIAGAAAAGTMTGLLGNRPQPVLAAAGGLTLLITAAAWAAGLRRQDAASVTAAMRGN